MPANPLHITLWRESRAVAEECLAHPFVRGLADGNLDPGVFKHFVAQDTFFLRAFFSAYALAAVKTAEKPSVASRLHRLMGGVLDELKLHTRYAENLGIDLADVRPNPAARAYTDFLLRTAWMADIGEIIAAMTPCMRLYAYLGQELAVEVRSQNPYREWIETYSSDEFESLAGELESLLDQLGDAIPGVASAYRYAMLCERDFFSSSLTQGELSR